MELQSISCNNCGGPVEVTPKTNFAKCTHCGSNLALRRTSTSTYTDVLDQIESNTSQTAAHVEVLRLKTQLDLLDEEWVRKRTQLQRLEPGELPKVDRDDGFAFLALSGGIGLTMLAGCISISENYYVAALVFTVITIVLAIAAVNKFKSIRVVDDQVKARLERKRQDLRVAELDYDQKRKYLAEKLKQLD